MPGTTRIMQVVFAMIVIFALLALSRPLFAQTEEENIGASYGDEAFISIATGRSKLLHKAPAVASVITAEQIRESGARTIGDVLETVPGLHVSVSSARLSPVYSIRGIHTDKNPQVLMLLNGVALTQLTFGDRGPLSTMPVAAISRIEIIRGPGSAVYGADAFAGVINIMTKTAEDYEGVEAGARLADFGTRDGWLSYGSKLDNGLQTSFNIQLSTTDGDEDRVIDSDAQSFFDASALPQTSVSHAPDSLDTQLERLDINLELSSENWSLRYWSRHLDNAGSGPGAALALDPSGQVIIDDFLFDISAKNILESEAWDTEIRGIFYDINIATKHSLFPPGTRLPIGGDGNVNPDPGQSTQTSFPNGFIGNPEAYEQHSTLEVVANSLSLQTHEVRVSAGIIHAGVKTKEEKNFGPGVTVGTLTDVTGTDYIYMSDNSRDVFYLSFQDEINLAADWALTAGIRYDDYSDFGDTVNPRLALVWETRNNLTTKFLYGRAFRPPSFMELFAINNPVVLGNPELDPEVINTVEIAFDYAPNLEHHIGFNMYAYEIEDLIQFVPDGSGASTSTAQNTGNQTGQGLEVEWIYNLDETLSFGGNLSLAKATDKDADRPVANFPEKQFYLSARWAMTPGWKLAPEFHYVGERARVDGDPRDELDGYILLNLAVTAQNKTSRLLWGFGIKNVTDEEIFEPSPYQFGIPGGSFIPGDFPGTGRMAYITGSYKF